MLELIPAVTGCKANTHPGQVTTPWYHPITHPGVVLSPKINQIFWNDVRKHMQAVGKHASAIQKGPSWNLLHMKSLWLYIIYSGSDSSSGVSVMEDNADSVVVFMIQYLHLCWTQYKCIPSVVMKGLSSFEVIIPYLNSGGLRMLRYGTDSRILIHS